MHSRKHEVSKLGDEGKAITNCGFAVNSNNTFYLKQNSNEHSKLLSMGQLFI